MTISVDMYVKGIVCLRGREANRSNGGTISYQYDTDCGNLSIQRSLGRRGSVHRILLGNELVYVSRSGDDAKFEVEKCVREHEWKPLVKSRFEELLRQPSKV